MERKVKELLIDPPTMSFISDVDFRTPFEKRRAMFVSRIPPRGESTTSVIETPMHVDIHKLLVQQKDDSHQRIKKLIKDWKGIDIDTEDDVSLPYVPRAS